MSNPISLPVPAVETADGASQGQQVWPAKPSSGRGRKHGTSATTAFDRWFRYPAGFATDYADLLMSQLRLPAGAMVVDPFAGSGVVGTAARRRHLGFLGIEAHPMVAELAGLKLQCVEDLSGLVAAGVRATTQSWGGAAGALEDAPDLVRRSFTAPVLETLMGLRSAAMAEAKEPWGAHLKWALLATLRDVAAVKVGWPYQRPGVARQPRHRDPSRRFLQRVEWMAEDLASVAPDGLARRVAVGDSRDSGVWERSLHQGQVDGSVSSPPYLNNFDYADATRLEAYFWGEASTWAELVSVIRADMLSASTQQVAKKRSELAMQSLEGTALHPRLEVLVSELFRERRSRSRGKEYDRLLPEYFQAMHAVLQQLAWATREGAPAAWLIGDSAPYGVHVDTPTLIGVLAEEAGFAVESDVILRFRGQRWASARSRHQQPLTERLLVLRRQ